MKDITHYFGDVSRNGCSESASVPMKEEVRGERGKVEENDENVAVAACEAPARPKRKRGRVKIKISRTSSEDAICDIVESSADMVDKTPSPFPKPKRRHVLVEEETGSGSTPKSTSSKKPDAESTLSSDTRNKHLEGKRLQDDVPYVERINDAKRKKVEDKVEDDSGKKKKIKVKQKQTEKLIELADKKGYSKRKILEEEEATKIEKRLEKRKKFFTIEPSNNSEVTQSDENTPKNNNFTNGKRSGNLLNYFSKATPEHLEKERLTKAKLTVKAEIHTPQNSPVSVTSVSDKRKKDSPKKKVKSNSKQLQEEFDEIKVIQTETLILSPKKEKLKSPMQQSKPKWSLKIQLQSCNIQTSGIADDEEIYTPTATPKLQKENLKNCNKIHKILLPMKNKKGDLSNSSSDGHNDNNKKEERKSLIIDNGEKLKTEKMKTESNNNSDSSTTKECETNKKSDSSTVKECGINKKLNKPTTTECKTNKKSDSSTNKKSDSSTTKECETNCASPEIEIIEDECQIVEQLKKKSKEKLAPLFTKRTKPTSAIVAARRLFLQSDILENNNGSETPKSTPVTPRMLPFPKISHVNQLPLDTSITNQAHKFTLKDNENIQQLFDLSHMKTASILNNAIYISENVFECVKSDIETVLSEIELYCTDVQSLWKSISMFSKSENSKRTPKTRRRVSDKKKLKELSNNSSELFNSPWTDKYKPNSSAEIVGNEEAAIKFKSWLDSWRSFKNREDYSSSEEFYTSDCSMSSNIENNQVAVLVGPHGSGKTASVYAVAQELGYKVLEVNASSKRPGKKILKDFEEATKSHRVKKSTLKDVFTSGTKKSVEPKKISQNSLILMEDVDLIFEEDEGFVSATFQLASNTKRPIVMTLRDTCSYLTKMAPQQLRINFQPVSGKRVLALLQLIALAETGCKLSQNCIDVLCQNGDLRKGLLQLQYLLLSGKERISPTSLAVNNSTWNVVKSHIYKPAIKTDKIKKKKQTENDKKLHDTVLDELVSSLDKFSLMSTLIDIEDPTSCLIDIKSEPCMSLEENTRPYSSLESTSSEMGSWLKDAIMKSTFKKSKKSHSQVDTNNQLLTKKQVINGVDLALSQIASNTLDRRALAVDYLSSIRTICRAEEIRNQLNSKRGNRFFHYLQSSRLASGAAKSSNILSAACKMLQEKSTIAET